MSLRTRSARRLASLAPLILLACGGAPPGGSQAADGEAILEALDQRSNEARLEAHPERAVPFVEEYEVTRYAVGVEGAPRLGASDPLVTIVTFSDFQCPFCTRVQPTLRRILEEYPDDVQLVFRNNPLPMHNHAELAAEAAAEAHRQGGDAMFWRFHDLLFENQRELERSDLEGYAQRVGLDMAAFSRALDEHTHRPVIEADQVETNRMGARGTPAFFINGRQLMGAQPFDAFEEVIEEELALARSDVARGARRGNIYAMRMDGALDEAPDQAPGGGDSAAPRRVPDPSAIYRVPIDGRPSLGPADALVTVVMFSDYQCPFCSRVQPTLEQLRTQYGRDVRVVALHNPLAFHDRAMPAAQAAEEVLARGGPDAFYRYSALLYDNQRSLDRQTLGQLAQQVGVAPRHVFDALDQDRHRSEILTQQQLAVSLGASGTPAFFINGRNVRGAQPIGAFTTVVDEELDRARALVSSGAPRAQVYARATANGATSAQTVEEVPTPTPARPVDGQVYPLAAPSNAPSLGPASAPVTIQIFSDFQCPFCSRVVPTLRQVRDHYGDRVRFVWHDYPLPFHDRAMPAAEVGREVFRQAGSDAFWNYHNTVFDNRTALEDDDLVSYATQSGNVDAREVRAALRDRRHESAVRADMQSVADAGMRIGTPSFLINGHLLQGAQPFPAFRRAIDDEMP